MTVRGQKSDNWLQFKKGSVATLPLIVGAIPFGILFGTLAQQSGLSIIAAICMSFFVFAGSAQFIALGLVAAGASVPVIILTTFIVNIRHLLYSTALVPKIKHLPQSWRAVLSFGLTDETFAAVSQRYQSPDVTNAHWFYLGSVVAMWGNWQLCTWIGLALGSNIPGIESWGLEFAMVVTFIGVVVPYLSSWSMIVSVTVAGVLAILCIDLPHNSGLIVAALSGISVGLLCDNLISTHLNKGSI
ncbi:branched-chain amino acid ABC transporter permease [Alginatibacterium sediminis]|uniref:Branched-chain amino acid ABC transporter permease n=1 Tax=Alginatibacterium sediminis TaxID=2164068 RepID=A0A420E803_9ALTE|nr:AzlC family ABC transporter permease [Alginatibacterium sediminis]RKF14549.1 branched-chain amino acid ABC transporter permease [Alginatibacterium sediminis]